MDLRQRLARLDRSTNRAAAAGDRVVVPVDDESGIPEAPPAELGLREWTTAAGPCWLREWREAGPPVPETLPDLTGILSRNADRRPTRERILLMDTETTGLAGGTGTLAFLVGLAWWEGGDLVVRQLLLPGPGREAAILSALGEWAAPFEVVATFNGAAFDLPLLRTRALMNRRPDPLAHLLSWDLLPACRRLWGRVLPDCRQQTVEAQVCGLARGAGDIDGARIPEVWRAWLAGEGADELLCVLRHNRWDLAGMAWILDHLSSAATAASCAPEGGGTDWRRAWSLAKVAERRREEQLAADWLAAALAAGGLGASRQVAPSFVIDAVRILKRARRWLDLEALLAEALAKGAGPWAHREAAILYEHRLARLETALGHARQCGEPGREERLRRRLARAAPTEPGEDS